MKTVRLALVFVVLPVSVLLALWAFGLADGGEVADASRRTAAVVAIGGIASSLAFALLDRRRPPSGGGPGEKTNEGPKF